MNTVKINLLKQTVIINTVTRELAIVQRVTPDGAEVTSAGKFFTLTFDEMKNWEVL